jgi:pimeloyl-ACP methyl ester carboxylesterase
MSARSWDRQLENPPSVSRAIALLPGHGESSPPPGSSVEEYADAVADFLIALERAPVVVVGHSLGGSIAIALAARRPALVRGVVLIASCVKLPPALDVPALVLVGSRDRLATPVMAQRLASLIRGGHLRIVEGAGHMLQLEAPEEVNRAIATFVESPALPSPATTARGVRVSGRTRRVLERMVELARKLVGSFSR